MPDPAWYLAPHEEQTLHNAVCDALVAATVDGKLEESAEKFRAIALMVERLRRVPASKARA